MRKEITPTRTKSIRLTLDEWAAIEAAAEAAHLSTHAWIRIVVNAALGSALRGDLMRVRKAIDAAFDPENWNAPIVVPEHGLWIAVGKRGWYTKPQPDGSLWEITIPTCECGAPTDPIEAEGNSVRQQSFRCRKCSIETIIVKKGVKPDRFPEYVAILSKPDIPTCECGSLMALNGEFDGREVWICPGCGVTRDKKRRTE